MKSSIRLTLLCVAIITGPALAQSTPTTEDVKQKEIADVKRRISEVISTKDYQDKIPFGTFLQKLNQQLSKESKRGGE